MKVIGSRKNAYGSTRNAYGPTTNALGETDASQKFSALSGHTKYDKMLID